MIVVHDVGTSKIGELAVLVVVGERDGLRVEHNQPPPLYPTASG